MEAVQETNRMQEEFDQMTDSSKNIKQENDALRTLNENLKKELNDSRASLEQENDALRTLNRNLKEPASLNTKKVEKLLDRRRQN